MRLSRKNRKRYSRRDKLVNFLLFFIIAPLVSVMIAFGLVKHVLLPNIDKEVDEKTEISEVKDESKSKDNDKEVYEFKDLVLYSIQTGSFDDIENGKLLVKEMNSKQIPGFILEVDNDYKVFAGTFLDREEAERYNVYVKGILKDSFINEKRVEIKSVRKEGLANIINTIKNSYEEETALLSEQLKDSQIKSLKVTIDNNNKKILEQLNNYKNDDEDRKSLNKFLQKRQSMIDNAEEDIISEYYRVFYNYINIIKVD
ncbi:SPOR domain-containing protein [Clostridiisalibacter paucivorans]|uniref:SPOR domain-containing protein n=1 Tax=Clostridiisalibacter paucivorans TaxID=408753 RepID=UPI00047D99AC|nr:SPOR domain-containing protein [Clostridiisalibacter paucivorans]